MSNLKPLLYQALLRLSRQSGLHPTCLVLSGLEKVGQQIAGGGYGDIWKGQLDGQTVAVKSMRLFRDDDVKAVLKEFGREALIWRQLSHPNLLPFFGMYTLDNRLCIVSPWMEYGHLQQFLRNASPGIDRVSLIGDVAMGLEYLHRNHIVHGDLKAPNILVTPSGRACIADFGLSSVAEVMSLRFTHSTQSVRAGTVRYQAPELLLNESPNHYGSDVYAFACVCYEILTGKTPFFEMSNDMAVALKVIGGSRPSRPGMTYLWKLLDDCWEQKTNNRPVITQILQRLVDPPIFVAISQPATDWDETCSAKFRRSVQEWPLRPSVTQLQLRITDTYHPTYFSTPLPIYLPPAPVMSSWSNREKRQRPESFLQENNKRSRLDQLEAESHRPPVFDRVFPPQVHQVQRCPTNNFLNNLDLPSIPLDYKKEGGDWFAVYNPEVRRTLDVDSALNIRSPTSRS
ncbi:kinase-like domain-containing protein [Mycena galericulata]|nr:kinase-like domain-containing protein [Mycena galericulata]